jgi:energy-coupling factor transporter ATP-binding protein EcfA2
MSCVFPLLGFSRELDRLKHAFAKRESLLIIGAAGAGKTALIQTAIAQLPNPREIVAIRYSANPHTLLVDLTRSLLLRGHRELAKRAKPGVNIEKWLAAQTSVHLKGLLWTSLESEPRILVLDGIEGASFPMYRFLQRLYFARGTAIIAAAGDPAALGALGRLFWDPRSMIHIPPLSHADAEQLFDLAVKKFGLEQLDVNEFREKVLESARGNPGQIIEMCRLAANPHYLNGRHILFAPLRIDVMMRFLPAVTAHRPRRSLP